MDFRWIFHDFQWIFAVLSSSTDLNNFIQACQCCYKTAICGMAQVHHGCVKLLESGWFGNGGEGSRLSARGWGKASSNWKQ